MYAIILMTINLAVFCGTYPENNELPGYMYSTPLRNLTGDDYRMYTEFPVITHSDLAETLPWTVFLYDDADFNGYDPIGSFSYNMRSSDIKNVIVLQDSFQGPSSLHRVLPDGTLEQLEDLGEVNMSSPETLKYLLCYARVNYPAERYFMAVYDHGGGWYGSCIDATAAGDLLRMNEKQMVMENFPGIDILAFTAPCLMGASESAYELRDLVDVYIASEDVSGYVYWMDTMEEIADLLENSSSLSNEEIGSQIIDIIEVSSNSMEWLTMAAVKCSDMTSLAEEIDALAQYMIDHMEDMGPELVQTRSLVTEMGMGGTYMCTEIDLGDFLFTLLNITQDPVAITHLQQCQTLLYQAVINECHGTGQEGVTGLSILFPEENNPNELLQYSTWEVDFADNTRWNEFLEAYFDWYESGIGGEAGETMLTVVPSCNPVSTQVCLTVTGDVSDGVVLRILDICGRTVFSSTDCREGVFHWNCLTDSGRQIPAGVYTAVATIPGGETASIRILVSCRF